MTIPDRIRAAIRRELKSPGVTLYRVAKDAGVHDATLRRFMAETNRDPSAEILERLLDYLGATVNIPGEKKGR